jgi:hypothetical protein
MNEEKHEYEKQGLLEFCVGILPHLEYSSLKNMHFVHHWKTPSLDVGIVHRFTFEVDQFHYFWHVDLSQRFHGTKKLDFQ